MYKAQNVLMTENIWFTCTRGLEGYYNNVFLYRNLLLVLDYLNTKHVNKDLRKGNKWTLLLFN